MTRFALAAALLAGLGTAAFAQPPVRPLPYTQPGPPLPDLSGQAQRPNLPSTDVIPRPLPIIPETWNPAPTGPIPNPVAPLPTYVGPPGPGIPYQKSTGLIVGTTGYYPYDTGAWLLGGTDGLTRQSGAFTMVFPGGNAEGDAPAPVAAPCKHGPLGKRLFCR
jgi:hypothetical protein